MIKKLLVVLLTVTLFFLTVSIRDVEAKSNVKQYYKKAEVNLNVRQSASINSKKLGVISKGSKVYVMAPSYNKWVPIQYKGKKAYVSSKYLKYVEIRSSKWVGSYTHSFSGSGNGMDLLIYKQTDSKIYFGFSNYGREDSKGYWNYSSTDKMGSAKLKNGKGYYSSKGCKITFKYEKGYQKNYMVSTYTNGACEMLEEYSAKDTDTNEGYYGH